MCTCAHTSCHADVRAQALLDNTTRAHSGFCAALWDNKRKKKKLPPRIRGITTKSTTAERIDKTEQDGPHSDKSDRRTDSQTD